MKADAISKAVELAELVIASDLRAMSQLLSRIEDGEEDVDEALNAIYPHTGRAHIVGITGVPGAGKSTLVSRIAAELRRANRTVGIIAIDPSSALSGGAILGDRIRMADHGADRGVFIRSMATRGGEGGLSRATLDAIDVLDAAGFDVVLVETVGVGQDEFEISNAAHTTVVVSAPGLGDAVQAMKAGILEMADIHVVNKADRPEASRTLADLGAVMHMVMYGRQEQWTVPVLATSAETGAGIAELVEALDRHRQALLGGTEGQRRHEAVCESRLWKEMEDMAVRRIRAQADEQALAATLGEISSRAQSPRAAARALLRAIWP